MVPAQRLVHGEERAGPAEPAAGLAAAATSTGLTVGNSIKSLQWQHRAERTPVVNALRAGNSNSVSNTNSNVNSGNPDFFAPGVAPS